MSHLADGLIRAVAPVAAHLAEDAWQNLPFQSSAASVFQAGWQAPQADWSSLSEQDQADCRALLAVRAETNQVRCTGPDLVSWLVGRSSQQQADLRLYGFGCDQVSALSWIPSGVMAFRCYAEARAQRMWCCTHEVGHVCGFPAW